MLVDLEQPLVLTLIDNGNLLSGVKMYNCSHWLPH